jgi:membrane protease YdiL (CAAX protease family)
MVSPEDDAGRRQNPLDLVERATAPGEGRPSPPVRSPDTGPGAPAPPTPLPPVTRGDGGTWVFLTLVGFLIGQIAGFVLVVIAAAVAHQSVTKVSKLAAPPQWYVVSSLIGVWIGFALSPFIASRVAGTRRVLADMRVRFRPVDVVGVAIGAAAQGAVWLLYYPFRNHLHNYEAPVTKLTGSAHGGGYALIAVLTVAVAPFFEELFFRGLLLRGLLRVLQVSDARRIGRWMGVGAALVLDGVLFAGAHAEWQQFAGLALFGVLLAFISWRTGRQGMNMVAHASFNLVTVVAVATVAH